MSKTKHTNELVDVHYDGKDVVTYVLRDGWKGTIYVRPPMGQFIEDAWRAWENLLRDIQDIRGSIKPDEPSGDEVKPNPAVACQDATDFAAPIKPQKERPQ